jgi:hypothetical protein
MSLNLNTLKEFLYNANENGYAGAGQKILPERPGYDEIEYQEGDWYFRDSYAGHYFAPGQETVYFQNEPVWSMAYSGGMKPAWHHKDEFTKETIVFLKQALLAMEKSKPFRGPAVLKQDDWQYVSHIKGDVKDFIGNEKIFYKNELVFEQNYIGGVII